MPNLVQNPFPVFTDVDGDPLEDGYIFIGVAGLNPISNPLQAYWDPSLTVPASNIRTKGGYPVYNGAASRLYTSTNYSILVQDKRGATVYSLLDSVDYFNAPSGQVVLKTDTIADLRLIIPTDPAVQISVAGYYTAGDGGGGPIRYWNTASTAADNGASIIKPTAINPADPGRWLWSYGGIINAKWTGAKGDGITDDSAAVQIGINLLDTGQTFVFESDNSFVLAEVLITNKESVIIQGGIIQTKVDDIDHAIRIGAGCSRVTIQNIKFIGTSDDSIIYDGANRRDGIDIRDCAFPRVINCTFEKYASFGIFVQDLTGGTEQEGALIDGCIFRDFPFDNTSVFQCGILMSEESEYSIITNNQFFRIPQAIRFDHGANSIFTNNIVMELNANKSASMAALFANFGTNNGKLTIANNKFNHIETGQYIILIKGDVATPQNTCIISNNQSLVTGDSTQGFLVYLIDMPYTKIIGNDFRPQSTVAGEGAISLVRSDNCVIIGNTVRGGDYAVSLDDTFGVKLSSNVFFSQATGNIIEINATETWFNTDNLSIPVRITGSGVFSVPIPMKGWTIAKIGTGHYQLDHGISSISYGYSAFADNISANPILFTFIRGTLPATTLDIYTFDIAGVLTDATFILTLHLSPITDDVVGWFDV